MQLSEVTRRRIAAVLLVAGVVVGALAILDVGPFSDPPTPEEEVRATVERLYDAASAGDFETYCGLLTERARELVRVNAARLAQGRDLGGCQQILERLGSSLLGGELRIREVSVSGNRARVEANLRLPEVKGAEARTILLELDEQGEWRVSEPG
ncbi:MAG TPA: hypothetical protein VIL04_06355 [Solirubrobacterales bacterium]